MQKDHHYLDYLNALFDEEVSYETVTQQSIKQNPDFKDFIEELELNFAPAAIQTSYKRIIQGKQ